MERYKEGSFLWYNLRKYPSFCPENLTDVTKPFPGSMMLLSLTHLFKYVLIFFISIHVTCVFYYFVK